MFFEQRARWSFLSKAPREGYFRLFNKNAWRTQYVRIVRRLPDAMIWVVEADHVDPYFKHVLKPYAD